MDNIRLATKLRKQEASQIIIYIMVFLFALHVTPSIYINSSFLGQFIGDSNVGYIYTAASLLALVALWVVKSALNIAGNYKIFFTALIADFIAMAVMATSLISNDPSLGPLFIIAYIVSDISRNVGILNLDIFLEHFSTNKDTGGIRGIYLTSLNSAFILGPLIAGVLISDVFDAGKVYIFGVIALLPVIYMTWKYFRKFSDDYYKKFNTWETTKKVFQNKNLFRVFASDLTLKFFYSWMIIYTPIFLRDIGFNLSEVGLIMGVALVPFVLLEAPLGKIADKWLGEKEIMSWGFVVAGIAAISMTFFSAKLIWLWMLILFVSRVGASMIEVMVETYLFKKIDDEDIHILSLFRANRPVAYIVSPIVASLLLIYVDLNLLFIILGLITIHGINFSLRLKDTK